MTIEKTKTMIILEKTTNNSLKQLKLNLNMKNLDEVIQMLLKNQK